MRDKPETLLNSNKIEVVEALATKQPNQVLIEAIKVLHDLGIPSLIKDIKYLYQEMLELHRLCPDQNLISPEHHSDMVCRMFQAADALRSIEEEVKKGGLSHG